MPSDIIFFLQWWLTIELLGLLAWPLAKAAFKSFLDEGWAFSKILGILLTSYFAWLLASIKLFPFSQTSVFLIAAGLFVAIWIKLPKLPRSLKLIIVEEGLFLGTLALWSWIRGFSPDIHGLEKYMDYGFVLSILRSDYFPPLDHFLAGATINYYYFGHLIAAVLTKLSSVPANFAFNLQIANLCALTALGGFSLGSTLFSKVFNAKNIRLAIVAGLLTAVFLTSIGNLHAAVEYLAGRGQNYWYPTATRLIPFTIDEFPLYSFIVADLHGHVSDLPIVLLTLGLLFTIVWKVERVESISGVIGFIKEKALFLFLAFTLGAMYCTNAWDFAIYLLAVGLFFLIRNLNSLTLLTAIKKTAEEGLFVLFFAILFYLPYWLTVKPLSQGIGLTHGFSPFNLVLILWGFYFFIVASYLVWVFKGKIKQIWRQESLVKLAAKLGNVKIEIRDKTATVGSDFNHLVFADKTALLLIFLGFLMILIPEIIYLKDIYIPDYYRANTMFKFYYEAWVFFSVAGAYAVMRIISYLKDNFSLPGFFFNICFFFLFSSVLFYSYIALKSSTGNFGQNQGLNGTNYLQKLYPDDAKVINWFNQNVKEQPTILEAVGDSYTDYSRISANTGLPTVLGWPVHEWLWRGSYDEAGKRTAIVKDIYETADVNAADRSLKLFKVKYVVVGTLEKEKYPNLEETKFSNLGKLVFQSNESKVYKID